QQQPPKVLTTARWQPVNALTLFGAPIPTEPRHRLSPAKTGRIGEVTSIRDMWLGIEVRPRLRRYLSPNRMPPGDGAPGIAIGCVSIRCVGLARSLTVPSQIIVGRLRRFQPQRIFLGQ